MVSTVKQRTNFVLFVLATIAALVLIGYFSASKKSEPNYLSKIDRIMFDKKNKSPKFVLTLPDKWAVQEKKVEGEIPSAPLAPQPEENTGIAQTVAEDISVENMTPNDLLDSIPLISKLTPLKDPKPLRIVESNPDLVDRKELLTLPKMAENGTKPWAAYAYSVEVQPNFSKVAIVIKNVGLDKGITDAVLNTLPSEVSVAFSPYSPELSAKVKQARLTGHETYMDWLLSSQDVLKSDNGPLSMSLTASLEENMQRLKRSLNVEAPIGGMVINDGLTGADNAEQLQAMLNELKSRGLLVMDATSGQTINILEKSGLAHKRSEIVIEKDISKEGIESQLKYAEQLAKNNGQVMIVATPKPIILNAINDWVKTFSPQLTYEQIKATNAIIEKPFALVPVSNLVVE